MYSYSDYKGKLSESEFEVANNLIDAIKTRGYGLDYFGKESFSCNELDKAVIINSLGSYGERFSISDPDGGVICNIFLDVTGGDGEDLISSVKMPPGVEHSYWDIIDMIIVDAEGHVTPSHNNDLSM